MKNLSSLIGAITLLILLSCTKKVDIEAKANESYLLGMQHYSEGLEQDLKQAIEYFERSIELDSTFALGYAGLASAYSVLGAYHIISPEEAWPKLQVAAKKALTLDAGLSEAHNSLALLKMFYEYDWKGAENEFKTAIELDPKNADAYCWFSWFLGDMGRHDEAMIQIEQARKLETHSHIINSQYSWALVGTGKMKEAIQIVEKEISSKKEQVNPLWHWNLANFYTIQGKYDEAITHLQTQMSLMGDDVMDEIAFVGYLYAQLGQTNEAHNMLQKLDELSTKGRYISPISKARIFLGLKDKDKVFALLKEGYDTRDGWMGYAISVLYTEYQDDPRFNELLKKMKLEI